jgi:hypothetical protein
MLKAAACVNRDTQAARNLPSELPPSGFGARSKAGARQYLDKAL